MHAIILLIYANKRGPSRDSHFITMGRRTYRQIVEKKPTGAKVYQLGDC